MILPHDQTFDLVAPYRSSQIFGEEIVARPDRWVMLFRKSMTSEIGRIGGLNGATLIYSLWPGYLDRPVSHMRSWCADHNVTLDICHTSGHADPKTLVRIAEAIKARMVIPIHTDAPDTMQKLIPRTSIIPDGAWTSL